MAKVRVRAGRIPGGAMEEFHGNVKDDVGRLIAWWDFETICELEPAFRDESGCFNHLRMFADGLYMDSGLDTGGPIPGSPCFATNKARFEGSVATEADEISIAFWISLPEERGDRQVLFRVGGVEVKSRGREVLVDNVVVVNEAQPDAWYHIALSVSSNPKKTALYCQGRRIESPQKLRPLKNEKHRIRVAKEESSHKWFFRLDEMRVYEGMIPASHVEVLSSPARYLKEDPFLTDIRVGYALPAMIQKKVESFEIEATFHYGLVDPSAVHHEWLVLERPHNAKVDLRPSKAPSAVFSGSAEGVYRLRLVASNTKSGHVSRVDTKVIVLEDMERPKGKAFVRPLPSADVGKVGAAISPLAYWSFENFDQETGSLRDASDAGHVISLHGTIGEVVPGKARPKNGEGKAGRVLRVNGLNKSNVNLRNSAVKIPVMPSSESFTISFWLKVDRETDFNQRGIISQWDEESYEKTNGIEIKLSCHTIRVMMRGVGWDAWASVRVRKNHWTHYAFVFGTDGRCRAYRNAESEFLAADGKPYCKFPHSFNPKLPFHLGASFGASATSMKGTSFEIDELAFYDDALNADEVTVLFRTGVASLTHRLESFATFPREAPFTKQDVWFSKRVWDEMCPKDTLSTAMEFLEQHHVNDAPSTESLFGTLPGPYVHPRIFFGLEELFRIRRDLFGSFYGKSRICRLSAFSNFNRSTNKNLAEPFTEEEVGSQYADLRKSGHSTSLILEALRALIQCDVDAARDLIPAVLDSARVITRQLKKFGRPGNDIIRSFQSIHMGIHNHALGVLYDFLYPFMDPAQRDVVREALQLCTQNYWCFGLRSAFLYSFNWVSFGLALGVLAMAIEQEEGSDEETLRLCLESFARHIGTYYEPHTGGCLEGELKTTYGLTFTPAYARRLGHHAFEYKGVLYFLEKFLPSIFHPDGRFAIVGAGSISKNAVIPGSWRPNMVSDVLMGGYVFPKHPVIRHLIGLLGGTDHIGGTTRGINLSGWGPSDITSFCFFPTTVATDDVGRMFWDGLDEKKLQLGRQGYLPLSLYCAERGLLLARSDISTKSLFVYSEFLMSERGHDYFNSGFLMIISHGILWIQRFGEERNNRFGLFAVADNAEGVEEEKGQGSVSGCYICEVVDEEASHASVSADVRLKYLANVKKLPHISWFGKAERVVSVARDKRLCNVSWNYHNRPEDITSRRSLPMYETDPCACGAWKHDDGEYPPADVRDLEDLPTLAYRSTSLVRGTHPFVLYTIDHGYKTHTRFRLRLPLSASVFMNAPDAIDRPGIDVDKPLSDKLGQPVVILRPALCPHRTERCMILPLADPSSNPLTFHGGKVVETVFDTPSDRWTYSCLYETRDKVSEFRLSLVFVPFDTCNGLNDISVDHSQCHYTLHWADGETTTLTFTRNGPFQSTSSHISLSSCPSKPLRINDASTNR